MTGFGKLTETPVSILRALSDVRVEEDFPATLECEFSRQIIEVRWLKVKQTNKCSHAQVYLAHCRMQALMAAVFRLTRNTSVHFLQ